MVSVLYFYSPFSIGCTWQHNCMLRGPLNFLFQSVVLSPSVKNEKKVRSILEGLCSSSNRYYFSSPLSFSFIMISWQGYGKLWQMFPACNLIHYFTKIKYISPRLLKSSKRWGRREPLHVLNTYSIYYKTVWMVGIGPPLEQADTLFFVFPDSNMLLSECTCLMVPDHMSSDPFQIFE